MGDKRVLVVDDQVEISELLRTTLAEAGYETKAALNGGECLELFHSFRPDLVVLDVRLPDMDGWEVLSKLAKNVRSVPVLIACAGEHAGKKLLGFNLVEKQDYLLKPYDPSQVLAKVESLLFETKSTEYNMK